MTIHIDADYLLDEATVYPIRIDPTIEINYSANGAGAIEDVTINSLDGSEGSSATVWVGKREKYGISRILMRFPSLSLSSIASADKITNASVEIRDLMCEGTAMTVYCYPFTGNTWKESTVEWSNVNPNSYGALLSSNSISYSNGAGKSPIHRYSFNITAAVKGWKTGDYSQGKGIIFKASSSVENGSTYISKTIASYNRAEYRPTLSVTYISGSTQIVADGDYYLNNVNTGKYLKYVDSSSTVSGVSGAFVSLGAICKWQIRSVSGGYVIQSSVDKTKYLGVPMNSENKVVIVNVGSTAIVPSHCKWNITFSSAGGCFIKSAYNSKYLYSSGTSIFTSTDTGTYGSSTYDSRSWRIATGSNISGKELPASVIIIKIKMKLAEIQIVFFMCTELIHIQTA